MHSRAEDRTSGVVIESFTQPFKAACVMRDLRRDAPDSIAVIPIFLLHFTHGNGQSYRANELR